MGTMINVLLFVLASGMIPMFILKMNNDISFVTIVRYHIPYDICRFLIEVLELYWQYRYLFLLLQRL